MSRPLSSRRGIILLTTAIFSVAVIVAPESALAVYGEHRIYTGYVSSTAVKTQDWHDASATVSADWGVDIGQSGDPWGKTMRMLSEHRSGYTSMDAFRFGPGGATTCTGAEIWLQQNTSGAIIGQVRYIHIDVGAGVPTFWTLYANNGFTAVDLGKNSQNQAPSCVNNFIPHLHQADELLPSKNASVPFSLPIGHPSSWLFDYVW